MNNEKEKLKYEAPWLLPVSLSSEAIVAGDSPTDEDTSDDDIPSGGGDDF